MARFQPGREARCDKTRRIVVIRNTDSAVIIGEFSK